MFRLVRGRNCASQLSQCAETTVISSSTFQLKPSHPSCSSFPSSLLSISASFSPVPPPHLSRPSSPPSFPHIPCFSTPHSPIFLSQRSTTSTASPSLLSALLSDFTTRACLRTPDSIPIPLVLNLPNRVVSTRHMSSFSSMNNSNTTKKGQNDKDGSTTTSGQRFTPEEEAEFARISTWARNFTRASLPTHDFDFNFSRSSGPGGQNVNKVNTKAELRFSLKQAKWMPDWLKSRFINESSNKRYINSAGDIVIASDEHRSQKQNIEACIDKLYDAIQQSCIVPTATSEEQKAKVKKLAAAHNERRLEDKKRNQQRKERKSGGGGKVIF